MKSVNGWAFPDLDNHLSMHVNDYPNTSYQQETIDKALSLLQSFDLVLDIGANVGLHTVRFSKYFDKVVAFEPTGRNFECLSENTKSLTNITLNKTALGSLSEKKDISIPKGSDNCGLYSFVDFKDRDDVENETVEVITLDSFKLSPNLIKIDTQGFELEVLKGSEETLMRSKPVIITEIESKKELVGIQNFLERHGYVQVDSFRKDKIWVSR